MPPPGLSAVYPENILYPRFPALSTFVLFEMYMQYAICHKAYCRFFFILIPSILFIQGGHAMAEKTTNTTTEQIIVQISRNVKKYRLMRKMTQFDLASAIGIEAQYYGQLERGERHFQIDKIIKICSVLQVGIQDLVDITPVDSSRKASAKNTLERLLPLLGSCTDTGLSEEQLLALEKFITEILPLIK